MAPERRRQLLIRASVVAGAFVLSCAALWQLVNARSFQLFGGLVARVEADERVVALTFDDGPEPQPTRALLGVLSRAGVKTTFFLEGKRIEQHLETARSIVEAGHEVGNHSYTHPRMILRSPAFIASEIERTDDAIRAAGYRGVIHFRPPNCKKLIGLPWYLKQHERLTITWDIEPEFTRSLPDRADAIAQFLVERARPGSIILLHPMARQRIESLRAVGGIIDGLRARGFAFVTISELLTRRQ